MVDFTIKSTYNTNDLIDIMRVLRSDNGCPWDKEQTNKSIRNNLLEESYEVVDALDNDDYIGLQEELGDVLLQVVFHSQMADEQGLFSYNDVVDGICKKLIERHPHIFSDTEVSSVDDVLNNWDTIKQKTKEQKNYSDTLDAVPNAYPALMKAQKIQKRASKSGMDFKDYKDALNKVYEEITELECVAESGNVDKITDESGDLLFSTVNVIRKLGVDSEQSLSISTEKFIKRFKKVEDKIISEHKNMSDLSIEELGIYWSEVKKGELSK